MRKGEHISRLYCTGSN